MRFTPSRLPAIIAVGVLAALSVVAVPMSASAASITYDVTNNNDAGAGSLRDAVAQANAHVDPAADVITFHLPAGQEAILPLSTIDLTDGVTFDGSGTVGVSIAGGAASTYNLFLITAGTSGNAYRFENLAFDGTKAIAGHSGGAVVTTFSATEPHSIVFDGITANNNVSNQGPVLNIFALDTNGFASIINSTIRDNSSPAGNGGGALYFRGTGGTITLADSTFSGNTAAGDGGAVYIDGTGGGTPPLQVDRSTFTGNMANGNGGSTGRGGAIFSSLTASFAIADSTFSGNTSVINGGAIALPGIQSGTASSSIQRSTFVDNGSAFTGGAVLIGATTGLVAPGGISVLNSTFARNTLSGGSASGRDLSFTSQTTFGPAGSVDAPITITSSTFDDIDNATTNFAIYVEDRANAASLIISHSTVIGGLGVVVNNALVSVSHSIFWTPAVPGNAIVRIAGTGTIAASWSLSSGTTQPYITAGSGMQFGITNPGLNALASNGGPTQTRLPTDASAAHNTGDPAIVGAPATDQRGAGFARIVQTIDIGAAEIQVAGLAATGETISPWTPVTGGLLVLLGLLGVLYAHRRGSGLHSA